MNLFTDIDGVLLGKENGGFDPVLANHAIDYLRCCIRYFDCYWLTTHCRGDIETVADYLRPYANDEFMELVYQIAPTNFKTFKTEALFGDFIWVDDQPTAYEFQYLADNDKLHSWWQVDTRKNINELADIIPRLELIARQS
jgi:hypothetical protein